MGGPTGTDSRRSGGWRVPGAMSLVAVVLLGASATVWLVTARSDHDADPVAEAQTVSIKRAMSGSAGCLLTDSNGVIGGPAAEVWAGLQAAAAETSARASFLPLVRRASPSAQVNALMTAGCDLVIGAGARPVAAVRAAAESAPEGVRFAVARRDDGTTVADNNVRSFEPTQKAALIALKELLSAAPAAS